MIMKQLTTSHTVLKTISNHSRQLSLVLSPDYKCTLAANNAYNMDLDQTAP